jgi:hypothetical protein
MRLSSEAAGCPSAGQSDVPYPACPDRILQEQGLRFERKITKTLS